jgi:hypothetical protein
VPADLDALGMKTIRTLSIDAIRGRALRSPASPTYSLA